MSAQSLLGSGVEDLITWRNYTSAQSVLTKKDQRKMRKVYLAGGMEKAGEFGSIWRERITPHLESCGYTVWNPYVEEVKIGVNVKTLAMLKESNYDKFLMYIQRIVDHDLAALKTCALVAVRIDDSVLKGAGTYGELTMCRLFDIPVYAWIDLPNGERDVPSWAMGCLTDYTTDKHEFYSMLANADIRDGHDPHLEYVEVWSGVISDT